MQLNTLRRRKRPTALVPLHGTLLGSYVGKNIPASVHLRMQAGSGFSTCRVTLILFNLQMPASHTFTDRNEGHSHEGTRCEHFHTRQNLNPHQRHERHKDLYLLLFILLLLFSLSLSLSLHVPHFTLTLESNKQLTKKTSRSNLTTREWKPEA